MKALRECLHDFTPAPALFVRRSPYGFAAYSLAEGDERRRQRPLVVRANPASLKCFFPTVVTACERLDRRWHAMARAATRRGAQHPRAIPWHDPPLAFGTDVATLERDQPDPLQMHLDRIFSGFNRRLYAFFPTWALVEMPGIQARVFTAGGSSRGAGIHRERQDDRVRLYREEHRRTSCTHSWRPRRGTHQRERARGERDDDAARGEDTTAGTLAWAMLLLGMKSRRPGARQEAQAAIGSASAIETFEAARALPFLEAVILEALRLKPVAPLEGLSPLHETVVAGVDRPRVRGSSRSRAWRASTRSDSPAPGVRSGAGSTPMAVGDSGRAWLSFRFAPAAFCQAATLPCSRPKMALATTLDGFDLAYTGSEVLRRS